MGETEEANTEVTKMDTQFVVALALAIPIVLLPVALVWYLNLGGIYATVRRALGRKAPRMLEGLK